MPAEIILSRIQFAFTLSFHILFPTLTIGLAAYIAIWEWLWLRTGSPVYFRLCRFWTRIFALAFGMGVVSGIVLSYEFGTNFSKFSEVTGNILGPLMSYEVLTAFFLEAGFLGVMLFGWKRVSPRLHFAATMLVMAGTLFSTFWILSANSWMQTPAGYRFEDGVFYPDNWLKIIFNPSFPYRWGHMVVASYLASSFMIAGLSAWQIVNGVAADCARKSLSLALGLALVLAPLQILLGDMHGLNTLEHQPIKIAAIEGRWDTQRHAPLTLFALPDMKAETNHAAIEIPELGSLILTHDFNGEIKGLKSVPPQDRPYVPVPFFAFRVMVGIGLWLLALAIVGNILRAGKKLYWSDWFLRLCTFTTPLGFVAVLAGWFTTETGRQPWIVYGLMRTADGASRLPPVEVATSFGAFLVLYLMLLGAFILYLRRMVRQGPAEAKAEDTPNNLSGWLAEKGD
jgi:cytochrome d ubiquinol oxidase subunit I